LLAAWTLWRWRGHFTNRHLSLPLTLLVAAILACLLRSGSERALLLTLPALAVLASFALPTLNRSLSGMVDWFSVFFFSAAALFVWGYFIAMQTGWPPRMAASVTRLAPDFVPRLDSLALFIAGLGSVAWLLLVRWRTSAQRPALWRSLVLPAGGTTVVWLLVMTLWLPAIDYARSNRELLGLVRVALPPALTCIAVPGQSLSLMATLQAQGGWAVRAEPLSRSPCDWALLQQPVNTPYEPPAGWRAKASLLRPTERSNRYWVLERVK
jgi:4-amino-4-deoxy-L-arabinose transferase-like glycosyltransferase